MKRVFIPGLLIIASMFMFCSQDSDNGTSTDPTTPTQNDEFSNMKITRHLVAPQLPSQVTMLFQVTDLAGINGADFLSADRFSITEEGTRLDNTATSLYVLRRDELAFTTKTLLLIDNNAGSNLAALKKAAIDFINGIDAQQEIAVYSIAKSVQLVLDYTNDIAALEEAVNSIAEAEAEFDLYGGLVNTLIKTSDTYNLVEAEQGNMLLIVDGQDNVGSFQVGYAERVAEGRKLYILGYGNDVDATALASISGNDLYFSSADDTQSAEQAAHIQQKMTSYADGFYRVTYTTSQRDGENHSVRLTINQNTNTADGSVLEDVFASTNFVDVADGLYINWSYATPNGADLIYLMINSSKMISGLTLGGQGMPDYEWSIVDESIASINSLGAGNAELTAKGQDGDSTFVICKDIVNNVSDTAVVKLVTYQMGVVLFETWDTPIGSGSGVNKLTKDTRYPNNPTTISELTSWEIPKDVGDSYATRVRGYIHPTVSGNYTFYIASDDQAQFMLSTDKNPENITKMCEVTSWTNSREWTKESSQKSDPVYLEAGKVYYAETLHVEGTGGDNMAVAWELEGGDTTVLDESVISKYLGN